MKFQTHNEIEVDTNMSSLVGYVQATRAQLEHVFGKPQEYDEQSGDGKVTTIWDIQFADGTIATIYDWKRYEDGPPAASEVYGWHVGGKGSGALALVHEAFRDAFGLGVPQRKAA